ncbi:tetratricopeptide repeat-containing sulfotransferase family protein [Sedimenticola sp.]|uniref:tetratricopeptide repeat-containing sulfotransferase family protein n=1 Tax=Sedimenticola sp. TaxID=1940285 RepID=UPI003D0CAF0F
MMEIPTHVSIQQHLSAGDLAAARSLIEAVLEKTPDDTGAHYLLGLVLLQEGYPEQAIPYLQKSQQHEPDNTACLCNLGVALFRAGQAEEATDTLRRALQLRPDYAQARYSLGSAYIANKQPELAEEQFRELCCQDENNADYQCALADALRESGKWRQALVQYRRALQLNPDFARAHTNLGPMLAHFGQAEEALTHCRKAVELSPQSAQTHKNLGDCLFLLEQLEEAMDAYADAYEIDPDNTDLCVAIGRGWLETSSLEEAANWFQLAIQRDESNVAAQCGLGNVIREAGEAEKAVEVLQPLLDEHPENVDVLLSLSEAQWESGDAQGALEKLHKVRELQPQRLAVYGKLGRILSSSGDVEQAVEYYEMALAENAACIPALNGLATTRRSKLDPIHVKAMEKHLENEKLRAGQRAALHNGLAYYYDGIKEVEKAARHTRESNRYQWEDRVKRGWRYEPQEYEAVIDTTIETFDSDYFRRLTEAGCGNASEVPVFVVAMPRSGTTLTEQILARHSQVLGVGERPFASRTFSDFSAINSGDVRKALASLAADTRNQVNDIAKHYLAKLDELVTASGKSGIRRVVDKMPDNYSHLGWLLTLFPKAKIIHVKRDPRDVALSCWMTQFGAIRWACHPEHLTERIRQYQRMMQHWRSVIPERIFEFDYEELVADQENMSRQLVEWIGLDWEPQCLKFYESDRLVRTASVTQVREPIYNKSVAKWRRYEPYLRDLFEPITP